MEILAPAGNIDKFKIAVNYGADAVYCSGKAFGLRGAAGNFTYDELEEAILYAKSRNCKVYITINTYPFNEEMEGIKEYIKHLNKYNIDALIIADLGVFNLARKYSNKDLHVSTQASVCNIHTAYFWKKLGAKRIVLARELKLEEAIEIKEKVDIEIEMFIHGSMCMAYSGNCTISNYTSNRDANRGGCVNSCRWDYSINDLNTKSNILDSNIHLMNSKDLWTVSKIESMYKAGVDSVKVEGRMKSFLYIANTIGVYKSILNKVKNNYKFSEKDIEYYRNLLIKVPNRFFSEAYLNNEVDSTSVLYDSNKSKVKTSYIGIVKRVINENNILVKVKNCFISNTKINILLFNGNILSIEQYEIYDLIDRVIDKTKPNSLVYLKGKFDIGITQDNVMISG